MKYLYNVLFKISRIMFCGIRESFILIYFYYLKITLFYSKSFISQAIDFTVTCRILSTECIQAQAMLGMIDKEFYIRQRVFTINITQYKRELIVIQIAIFRDNIVLNKHK